MFAESFVRDGFLVLRDFFPVSQCEAVSNEALEFYREKGVPPQHAGRTMNLHQVSPSARAMLSDDRLLALLADVLGHPPHFLQSIFFNRGSQQPLHSDYLYMSTEPELQLCGVWIACEDVDENNGPLVYVPGSHRIPITNINTRYAAVVGALRQRIADERPLLEDRYQARRRMTNESLETCLFFDDWLDELQRAASERKLVPVEFRGGQGDVVVWHANLMHGGRGIAHKERTRRSLVAHYLTEVVDKYFDMNYVDRQNWMTLQSIDASRPAELQVQDTW